MRWSRLVLPCLLAVIGTMLGPGVAAAAGTSTGPRVVREKAVGDRGLDVTISSPALGRNVTTRLLLPRHWRSQPNRRWPVLYLLHGANEFCCGLDGQYQAWTEKTDVEELTEDADVLVVMPEGGLAGWYSNWWNHGNDGRPQWETFHLRELRQILERRYRAGTSRAIAGLSMGGFGALSYAARHPGMFRAAASYSGAINSRTPGVVLVVHANLLVTVNDPYALWGDVNQQSAIWKAHNPYDLARKLARVPVFLAAGDGRKGPLDEPLTPYDVLENQTFVMAKDLAKRLRGLGGHVRTDLYGAGTHAWPYWEQELHRSLPMLLRGIGAKVPPAVSRAAAR